MDFALAPCCWGVYWPEGNTVDWESYIDKATAAGYRATELGPYGYGPTDASSLLSSLKVRDLSLVAAAHVHTLADAASWPILEEKAHAICDLLAQTGGGQFILMDESEFYPKDKMGVTDASGWRAMVEQTTRAAGIAAEYGLKLAFHPHIGTCVETEAQIDRLLAETDPAQVGLCLDTGHHAYWNADPLTYLRTNAHRVTSVHLKNVDAQVRARVHAEGIHSDTAFEIGIMTDLAKGAVDIPEIVAELTRMSFNGPIVVEQDLDPRDPRDPADIAAANLSFLTGDSD